MQGKIDAPQKRKMDTADTKDQVLALIAVVGTAYKMMLARVDMALAHIFAAIRIQPALRLGCQ